MGKVEKFPSYSIIFEMAPVLPQTGRQKKTRKVF